MENCEFDLYDLEGFDLTTIHYQDGGDLKVIFSGYGSEILAHIKWENGSEDSIDSIGFVCTKRLFQIEHAELDVEAKTFKIKIGDKDTEPMVYFPINEKIDRSHDHLDGYKVCIDFNYYKNKILKRGEDPKKPGNIIIRPRP